MFDMGKQPARKNRVAVPEDLPTSCCFGFSARDPVRAPCFKVSSRIQALNTFSDMTARVCMLGYKQQRDGRAKKEQPNHELKSSHAAFRGEGVCIRLEKQRNNRTTCHKKNCSEREGEANT